MTRPFRPVSLEPAHGGSVRVSLRLDLRDDSEGEHRRGWVRLETALQSAHRLSPSEAESLAAALEEAAQATRAWEAE